MVVLNPEVIGTLGLKAAWDNYMIAQSRAVDDRTSRLSREIWARAAQTSMDRHFGLIEGARQMGLRDYTASPANLDKRS